MKKLYNAPEVDIVRFAPAMAVADLSNPGEGDFVDDLENEGGGAFG